MRKHVISCVEVSSYMCKQIAIFSYSCISSSSWSNFCSSGDNNGRCLQNLLCYGNSSRVQHCNVIAGSRCPAVSLHVITFKVIGRSCASHALYIIFFNEKDLEKPQTVSLLLILTIIVKMSAERTLTKHHVSKTKVRFIVLLSFTGRFSTMSIWKHVQFSKTEKKLVGDMVNALLVCLKCAASCCLGNFQGRNLQYK